MSESKELQKNAPVALALVGVHLLSINIPVPEVGFNPEQIFSVRTRMEAKSASENHDLIALISSFSVSNKEENKVFAEFTIEFDFALTGDVSSVVKVSDKKELTIDTNFMIAMNSVAYSTARGIIYMHLKGTLLQKVLLPLINPQQFAEGNKK